jgi:uncharacterized membrane protein YgcG
MDENRLVALIFVALMIASVSSCFHRQPLEVQQQTASPSPTATTTLIPTQRGPITDMADAFTADEEKQLDLLLEEMGREIDVEMVVLTVDSTKDQSMFDYSLAVAKAWRPGDSSGRGLLLTLAINDRNWRLQVSEQLTKELPDDVSAKLAEPSVALYKERKYAEGVETYARAILNHIKSQH